MSLFTDPDFQQKLLAFICKDRNFLKDYGQMVEAEDFRPTRRDGPQETWIIATQALDFYHKYHEPIGGMLKIEILDYARKNHLGDRQKSRLLELVQLIKDANKLVAVDALGEKLVEYKKERLKIEAVTKLTELMESGDLTDDVWLETCMQGVQKFGKNHYESVDYLSGLDERMVRREMNRYKKYPYFMIDPLDSLIKGLAVGHIGLLLSYTNRGKGLGLIHLDTAYLLQGLNVMHVTLEDPLDLVEDRLDGSISALPTRRLEDLPIKLRKRFGQYIRLLRSRMKIIDGTDGGVTVRRIREFWEQHYNRGFRADVLVIDYDDEIRPTKKQPERRFEFADIYRDLRTLAAEKQILLWTAAQTRRQSANKKIISGDEIAEDISKIRKVSIAVGIGVGDWGENSRYLYVAKHKFDRMGVGCHIMSDPDKAIFYDRPATLLRQVEESEEREKKRDKDYKEGE